MIDYLGLVRGVMGGADPNADKNIFVQATEFMEQWTVFMNRLGERQKFVESQLASLDNRMSYLVREMDKANEQLLFIINETNITPELHEGVLAMAQNDPRNKSGERNAPQ